MSYLPKAYKRPGPLNLLRVGDNTYQYVVEGPKMSIAETDRDLTDEIKEWLETNVGRQYTSEHPLQDADWDYRNLYVVNTDRPMTGNSHRRTILFSFKDKSKAALFKMWWGQ